MNLPTPLTDPNAYPIIGESEAMRIVWRKVKQVAPTNATVLITGETGVGKEVVAQTIHENSSRSNRLFKAVNCGVLYQDLLQSELFGHEKGAFTGATNQRRGMFELADKGTLFLDEIGEMSPEVQVKFLRVLETQEFTRLGGEKNVKVDVRIIAATNVDLGESVKDKKFRQDLYYRLNLFRIQIPPLRDRREDISPFVNAFISELSTKHNKNITGIKTDALNYLENADWPGNIRQLKNAVETAIIVSTTEDLELKDFPVDPEFERTISPAAVADDNPDTGETKFFNVPGTSLQPVQTNSEMIATGDMDIYKTILGLILSTVRLLDQGTTIPNAAVYKTILGLILSAVRLLEPNATYNDELPPLIPDEDTSWMQITDSGDTAAVLQKTLEVFSTIDKALEQRTDEGLIPLPISNTEHVIETSSGTHRVHEENEEDSIGKVGMTMTQIEREAIEKTLTETGGNKTEAARILDIGVRTLHRRLDDYKQETDEASGTLNQE